MSARTLPAIALLLASGCQGALPDGAAVDVASLPVTHGDPTDGDPAVVALLDGAGRSFCTGSLISARQVLTAAHCLLPPVPALAAVFLGSEPAAAPAAGRRLAVARRALDPGYDPRSRRHDLALLELADPVADVAPVPVAGAPLPDGLPGTAVRAVGFGVDDLASLQVRKRTGRARVDGLSADFVRLTGDPAQPCGGDSGGPIFLAGPDGVERQVGVVSHGDWLCASHSNVVRIDRQRAPFLDPHRSPFADGQAAGCAVVPAAPPPPAAWLVAALAAAALVGLRRRRSLAAEKPLKRR
jgi:MYXO-CTERM domain-containing protein